MHDQTQTQVAPTALFQGDGVTDDGGFLVNCNNPLMTAQQAAAITCSAADIAAGATKDLYIGRRNIEGGPRQFEYDHDNFRVVVGSKGELGGPFTYDIYASYYKTDVSILNENFFSKAHVQNALLVGGTAANPTCLSGSGCVPYNIFSDGGVSAASWPTWPRPAPRAGPPPKLSWKAPSPATSPSTASRAPGPPRASASPAASRSAATPSPTAPDQAELSNDLTGFGGAAVSINNAAGVTDGYGEVRIPVAQDMKFIHDLSINGGYRYSSYSTGISSGTFKGGAEWAPTSDPPHPWRLHRAVRAPSLIELYTPASVTNTSVVSEDPCAAGAVLPASLAACAHTGVTAAQYGNIPQCPANQCAVLQGGNTALKPESADTFTVGAVLSPQFIPGFTASIDYFNIDLSGIIGTVPLGVSLNNCLATGDPDYCKNIIRNPVNGILFGTTAGAGGYLVGSSVNVAKEVLNGLDIQANYRLPLARFGHDSWGALLFSMNGSLDTGWKVTPLPGAESFDCKGLFGPQCQGLFPEWRHVVRATWNAPHNVQASVAWRYIGGAEYEADSDQPTIGAAPRPTRWPTPCRRSTTWTWPSLGRSVPS